MSSLSVSALSLRRLITVPERIVILAVVIVTAGSIAYINHSMDRIREALPGEVLQQQHDIYDISQRLRTLANALDSARDKPSSERLARVHGSLEQLVTRLGEIRRHYTFDSLTGASAAHALVNPATQDIERWMRDGVSGHMPRSPVALSLAYLRASETAVQTSDLLKRAHVGAEALLASEVTRIGRLRNALVILILTLAGIAAALVGLLMHQRNTQSRLTLEHSRLVDSMESMQQAFALFDPQARLVVCNQHYRSLHSETGREPKPGDTLDNLIASAIDARLITSIDQMSVDLLPYYRARHDLSEAMFEFKWHDDRYFQASEHATREGGTICVYTDVTDIKRTQQRMEYLATHDALTGLPARRYFERALSQAINRASRRKTAVWLMFIDVDRFKWVNDTYGHLAGDQFLVTVSQRLRNCMRDHDMVARLGGDEFATIIEETKSWTDVAASAERVMEAMSSSVALDCGEVRATVSIGIANYPRDGGNLSDLVKYADDACYHAKAQGRATYQFYTDAINVEATRHAQVESRLRLALQQHELKVHYQPQTAALSREVRGLEALVRWNDAELGVVSAHELVAVAEEAGLGGMLVSHVLDHVARDVETWIDLGIDPPRVWINVSGSQLATLDTAVRQVLQAHDFGESVFGIEITESVLVNDPVRARDTLEKLSGLGVEIAIDDFGVGYSSLAALKDYSLDALKIDAEFVRNVCSNPQDVQIVRAIVSLAHSLSLRVVAEGVETSEQLHTLCIQGVDEIQGHLVSQAMSVMDIARWLEMRARERQRAEVNTMVARG